jgi:hypothetical protein
VAFSSIHSCINISNEKKRQIDHAAAMYNWTIHLLNWQKIHSRNKWICFPGSSFWRN